MNDLTEGDLAYVRVPFDGIYEGWITDLSDKVGVQLTDSDREVRAEYSDVWSTFDQFRRTA